MKTTSMLFLCAVVFAAAAGCQTIGGHNLPPSERLMHPGPGVTGPGPGVLNAQPVCPPMMGPMGLSQVYFNKPEGMNVQWDVAGVGQFDSTPLICPARQNFPQGAIYRLKLTNIPGREGVELYPTIEVGPSTPRTEAFLAHNAIPVQYTEEDFDQVMTGNFVTKVIYLPDPEYQELALAGVETLVSTRLDPGVDPIVEADRRGAILAIIRLGNKDMEMPGMPMGEPSVMRASFEQPCGPGGGMFGLHGGVPGIPGGTPPGYVSGVTSEPWGMPITGTPIGLPGPPHVPLGGPAGLRKHVIKNSTLNAIPGPTKKVRIDVKQQPGFSYPRPANRIRIKDQTIHPAPLFRQPHSNLYQFIPPGQAGCVDASCSDCP